MDHANKSNFEPCLYVANLHPDVDEMSLYDKFSEVGPVTSVNLCRDVLTKQSLCYAYIKFKELCDMERAVIQLNFTYLNNMPIRVIRSNKSPEVNKLNVGHIFLKNLHSDVDNRELFNIFAQFGNIISCKIVLDNNNQSTGLGFVDYEDERCAEEAMKRTNGMRLRGMKVYAGKYIPRQEVSFHYVRIKNLPDGITEKKLKTMFEEIGPIDNTRISIYKSGTSQKFGFICFKDLKNAIEAVELFNNKILSDKIKCQGFESEKIELEYVNRFKGSNLYIKSSDNSCYGNGLYNGCLPYNNEIHQKKKRQSQSYRLVVSREEKQISKETNKSIEEQSSITSLEGRGNHASRTINRTEENAPQIINETNCSVGESKLPDKALLKNQDQEIRVCKMAAVTKETANSVKENTGNLEEKVSDGTTLTNIERSKQLQAPLQENIEQKESSKRKRCRSKSKSQPSNVALETNEEQKLSANSNNIQTAKKACHSVKEVTSQNTAERSNHELKLYSNVAGTKTGIPKTASIGESSSSKPTIEANSGKCRVVASEFTKSANNLIKESKSATTDLKKEQKTSLPHEQLHNKSPIEAVNLRNAALEENNTDPKVSSIGNQIHRERMTNNGANEIVVKNGSPKITLDKDKNLRTKASKCITDPVLKKNDQDRKASSNDCQIHRIIKTVNEDPRTELEKNMAQLHNLNLTATKASNSIKEANTVLLKKSNGDQKVSSNGNGTTNSITRNGAPKATLKNIDQLDSLTLTTTKAMNSIKEEEKMNQVMKVSSNCNETNNSIAKNIPLDAMLKNNIDQLYSLSLNTSKVSNSIKEANSKSLKQNNEDQKVSSNGKIIMTSNGASKTALEKNKEDHISSPTKAMHKLISEEIKTPNENKSNNISVNDNHTHFSTVPSKYPNNSVGGTKSSNVAVLKNNEKKFSPASSGIQMSEISTTKIPQKFFPNLPTVSSQKFQKTSQFGYNQMALPKMFPQPSCSPMVYQPYVVVFAPSAQYPVPPMIQRCLPHPPYTYRQQHPTLRESLLTNSNIDYIKQAIGENIYPKVEFLYPKLAPKITGMLLEQNALLLDMMEDNELLKSQVEEAALLLRCYSENNDDISD